LSLFEEFRMRVGLLKDALTLTLSQRERSLFAPFSDTLQAKNNAAISS
jgi:hypothetical protein